MTTQLLENRYRILQELGQGGFGQTFLAEDLHMPSNRRCVIKQLKPTTNDPAVYAIVKDRFQREAVILERLGEKNNQIPSLYAYFTEAGQFYLVQEWIEGQTLAQSLATQGVWSSAAVSQLLQNILPVLASVHGQGIVHRDIKPDNILIRDSDKLPVLIDFGAVKETMGTQVNTGGQTTSSIVIGTPGFMSSEQAIGRPVFSSDLYSLGLTAIYLLTGLLPQDFEVDLVQGQLLWQKHVPHLDTHLGAVLDQAISTHSRDRFAKAEAMLQALQAGSAATVATAPSIPPTVIPPKAPPSPMPQLTQKIVTPDPNTLVEHFHYTPAKDSSPRGMGGWQRLFLTGGMVGAVVFGGVMLNNQLTASNGEQAKGGSEETTVGDRPIPVEPAVATEPAEPNPPIGQAEPQAETSPMEPSVPPQAEEPPATPELLALGNEPTSAYGKYRTLIQRISCADDWENQGDYKDYGYWEGGNLVCGVEPKIGYWVYVYPDWYVWAKQVQQNNALDPKFLEQASGYGKYTNLLQVIPCEADGASQGNYKDYGYWEGGNLVCGVDPAVGYWVYVYPDWYVWADQR